MELANSFSTKSCFLYPYFNMLYSCVSVFGDGGVVTKMVTYQFVEVVCIRNSVLSMGFPPDRLLITHYCDSE
jgi:hypothetical protein